MWAARLGVPVGDDGSFDFRALAAGAVRAGSTPNGVFAARVMWGTMDVIVDGLTRDRRGERDLDVLTDAFGPLLMVHLRRDDVVAQAVSWARAEQTGYWQEGDLASAEPALDLDQVEDLVRTIEAHNAAWASWFAEQGVQPHRVAYERLLLAPERTVRGILDHVGVEPPVFWRPESPHRQQADEVNAAWVRRYRSERS